MKLLKSITLSVAVMLTSVSAGADLLLAVDIDTSLSDNTQSGFSQMVVVDQTAVVTSLEFDNTSLGFGKYTVRLAGGASNSCLTGGSPIIAYNTRNRTNCIANAGAFTQSDLIRERVAVWDAGPISPMIGFGRGPGLYVMVEGLDPNTTYTIQVWGADHYKSLAKLKDGYAYGFDATFETEGYSILPELGNYTVSGTPTTIVDNDQYSITGNITSDSSGRIIYKSISSIDGCGILNGFTLTSTEAPATGYAAWRGEWGVDIGSQNDDYDGDQFNNFYEYVLNGDPTNAENKGVAPILVKNGDTLEYIHVARSDDSNIIYSLEVKTNLTSGSWVTAYYPSTKNVTGGDYNEIRYTLPAAEKNYIRLKVEEF